MHEAFLPAAGLPAMVIALCFALGLNTYGCLLALGMLERVGWVGLPTGLDSLGHGWVLAVLGVLAVGEFAADKLPGLDVIWNVLHTVVRVPVAALVAFAVSSPLPMRERLLMVGLGMGFAGLAHGAKTALRVAVMPGPELVANATLSCLEDLLAVGLVWLALQHPMEAAVSVAGMAVGAVGLGCCGVRRIRVGLIRRFRDRRVGIGFEEDRRGAVAIGNDEKLSVGLGTLA